MKETEMEAGDTGSACIRWNQISVHEMKSRSRKAEPKLWLQGLWVVFTFTTGQTFIKELSL